MELSPAEVLKHWKAGRFAPVYYLLGEDAAARAEAVARLKALFGADDFNLLEFSGDAGAEAAEVVSQASTLPVFAERRLVVLKNPKIPASAKAALSAYLKDPLKSTTLVLQGEERRADFKDPLVKACSAAGVVCVFSPMTEEQARARLQAWAKTLGKALAEEAADVLVGEVGTDWSILQGELEKAALFSGEQPAIAAEDVLACLGYRKAANPWSIGDLIERRDAKAALAQLRALTKDAKADEQARSAFYKIRDVVLRQLKARRLQQARVAPDQIARTVRLYNPWAARQFLERASKLSEERLRRDLELCLECETSLNSKSWLQPRLEVERLVVDVCRKER
ncbi:MAG: DNA polymerase III subunit delta [Elusimicrobia bacterium]|nr:DNA polymerase III subunit delta [Elusimicrobiota bacterium]MDE2426549.1 DNA polymerase III subunit delta [Elusimicrobiota bacterium]